jgi:hypothetical protein
MGCFLYLLGFGIFILYLTTDFAQTPNYHYLLIALGIFTLAFLLRRWSAPPPSSGRFSTVRRLMSRRGKGEDDREE